MAHAHPEPESEVMSEKIGGFNGGAVDGVRKIVPPTVSAPGPGDKEHREAEIEVRGGIAKADADADEARDGMNDAELQVLRENSDAHAGGDGDADVEGEGIAGGERTGDGEVENAIVVDVGSKMSRVGRAAEDVIVDDLRVGEGGSTNEYHDTTSPGDGLRVEEGQSTEVHKPNIDDLVESTKVHHDSTSLNIEISEASATIVVEEPSSDIRNEHDDNHNQEAERTHYLDTIELQNLEGSPAPVTFPSSSSQDNILANHPSATQDSTISSRDTAAPITQGDEKKLPALPKAKSAAETKRLEIPDSDAITESSQNSPKKVTPAKRPALTPPMTYRIDPIENEDDNDGDGDSFERQCATSDEGDTMVVDGGVGKEDVPAGPTEEIEDSITVVIPSRKDQTTKKISEDIPKDMLEETPELELPIPSSQQKAKKRGRPPGRKPSDLIADEKDDLEPITKKPKIVEPFPEATIEVEVVVSQQMADKKKRGRPAGRKVSKLSNNDPEDEVNELPVPAEAQKAVDKKSPIKSTMKRTRTISKLSINDSEDDEDEVESPEKRQKIFPDSSFETGKSRQSPSPPASDHVLSDEIEMPLDEKLEQKKKTGRPSGVGRKKSEVLEREDVDEDGDGDIMESIPLKSRSKSSPNKKDAKKGLREAASVEQGMSVLIPSSSPEKRKRGRPKGRKVSGMIGNEDEDASKEKEIEDEDEEIVVHATAVKDASTEYPEPEKERRGRPAGRRISGILDKDDESDTEDIGMEDEEIVMRGTAAIQELPIHSSPEKKRRGRPGRKESGISRGVNDDDEVVKEKDADADLNIDLKDTSKSTPGSTRKRGRPAGRKGSELSVDEEPIAVEASQQELSQPSPGSTRKRGRPTKRKISELHLNEDELSAEVALEESIVAEASQQDLSQSSPDKKKRGRPAGRKISELTTKDESSAPANLENPIAFDLSSQDTKAPEGTKKRGRPSRQSSGITGNADVASKVAEEDSIMIVSSPSLEASLEASRSSPEKKKRGRPAGRKSSTLFDTQDDVDVVSQVPVEEAIVASTSNDPSSSPEKKKRGRPTGRKSSGITNPVDDADVEVSTPDDNKISTPESKKRGRPAGRKGSGLVNVQDEEQADTDTATAANDVEQEIQAESSTPSKDKRKRGRPAGAGRKISALSVDAEEKQVPDEGVDEDDDQVTKDQHEVQIESQSTGKKKRGRPSIKSKDLEVEEEVQATVSPKKKRGRPAGVGARKMGKDVVRDVDEDDDDDEEVVDTTIPRNGSKAKGFSSQTSTSSTPSQSQSQSQSQSLLQTELKAMKISALQTRNTHLTSEIAEKKKRLEEVTKELKGEEGARETVKRHIRLLHEYNEVRDVGQGLLGLVVDNRNSGGGDAAGRGVTLGEIYDGGEFGVGRGD